MKKILLSLALILTGSIQSFASHLMGGQIVATQISGQSYEIKMTLYRDTTGIPIAADADFVVTDLSNSSQQIVPSVHSGAQTLFNGVEIYEYSAIYTFAPGNYTISYSMCCRNAAILNMTNPGAESLFLLSELTVYPSAANSTPVFLNPPVTLAQKNALYIYNPLPFDADGDSIVWSLDTPMTQGGYIVTGYTIPTAVASNPFSLNSANGEITWMPDSNGHWEVSFLIEEFRNGVKTGEIRRDMQIIVVDDTSNYSPMVINTTAWPQDLNGNFSIALQPSVPFYFTVNATQQDNDPMDLIVQGEPMILNSNPASFSITSNGPGNINGLFQWTPSQAQARTAAYLLTVRGLEYHNNYVFSTDRTIMLRVGASTGMADNSSLISGVKSFPNPASGNVFVSFNLESPAPVTMEIYDLSGRLVMNGIKNELKSGHHLISQDISKLAEGHYVIRLLIDNKAAQSIPLLVR
jgi:hypothetical protein